MLMGGITLQFILIPIAIFDLHYLSLFILDFDAINFLYPPIYLLKS